MTRCQKVKSRREREIWNPYLEFREEEKEKCRDLFSGSRRERECLPKKSRNLQISQYFCAKVLVLFSNQKTDLNISLFSSRNSRCGFHISLSLLDLTFWQLVNTCHRVCQKKHFFSKISKVQPTKHQPGG